VGFLLWASWVFLCILLVYLGALFAYFNKVFLLIKKKKSGMLEMFLHIVFDRMKSDLINECPISQSLS
jgi:hypothetical protein